MTAEPPKSATTVERLVAPGVLDDLFASHYTPMVRLAHLMVGSGEVAEEIVQEAFVKVHRKLDRVDNPGAYLRVTVMNGCRNERRRRGIERRYAHARATAESMVDS